jgi:hypothetical protein
MVLTPSRSPEVVFPKDYHTFLSASYPVVVSHGAAEPQVVAGRVEGNLDKREFPSPRGGPKLPLLSSDVYHLHKWSFACRADWLHRYRYLGGQEEVTIPESQQTFLPVDTSNNMAGVKAV